MKFKLLVLLLFLLPLTMYGSVFISLEGGVVKPINFLKKYFSTEITGGLGVEISTEFSFINLQLKSYHYILSDEVQKLNITPLVLNANIFLPWRHSIKPYGIIGGGITWERLHKNNKTIKNIDPIFNGGIGIQYMFKSEKWEFGPYIESIYQFFFQKSQKDAHHNGETLLISLGVKLKVL